MKKPTKQKKPKDQPPKGAEPQDSADTGWWYRACEAHQFLAEHFMRPWEGITIVDLVGWAQQGDIIAQAFIGSLYKAVPKVADRGGFQVPDFMESLLLNHIRRLNGMLCDLAEVGRHDACDALWDHALQLSQTFCELALKNPDAFKWKARESLFMPSVRTSNTKFTADAKAIAAAIELSKDSVGDALTDNRKRIGALCARLVGECVHEIMVARNVWSWFFTPYKKPIVWPTKEEIDPFRSLSEDELISLSRHSSGSSSGTEMHIFSFSSCYGGGVGRLHFLTLPELANETAAIWWKEAVEKMIEAKFPSLLEQPAWVKELKAVSRGTKADMLKELKDYSREKVKQFAKPLRSKAKVAIRRPT